MRWDNGVGGYNSGWLYPHAYVKFPYTFPTNCPNDSRIAQSVSWADTSNTCPGYYNNNPIPINPIGELYSWSIDCYFTSIVPSMGTISGLFASASS